MTRHSGARRYGILLMLLSLAVLACARPRRILDPAPGALQLVLQDSTSAIMRAVERALSDEGLPVRISDPDRRYIESQRIDIASLKTMGSSDMLSHSDRIVTFRFFVRGDLGVTRLFGEVVYQPAGTDMRAMQRMVAEGHPARQVLQRMLAHTQLHLRGER